jgi:uncharacterized phiE125 gp8 family phage protein
VFSYGMPIHFGLARTTDPAVEPISIADMKAHLREDGDDSDGLIAQYITMARQKVEGDTRRALISQSWTLSMDRVPANGRPIVLPVNPVSAVTSITSYDEADASSVVATSVYRLDTASVPARIVLKDGQSWPSGLRPETGLVVVFVAGYGTTAATIKDAQLLQAIYLLVGHWYMTREAVHIGNEQVQSLPLGYRALVDPLQVPWL